MRAHHISLVLSLVCVAIIATAGNSQDPNVLGTKKALDCALYTKPYTSNEHGALFLPARVQWKVLPRYVGRTANGKKIVDDRITLVLQDAKNSFWPVIAKMDLEEVEALQNDLAAAIELKKKAMAKAN